jgi:hypothetical protein
MLRFEKVSGTHIAAAFALFLTIAFVSPTEWDRTVSRISNARTVIIDGHSVMAETLVCSFQQSHPSITDQDLIARTGLQTMGSRQNDYE